MAAWEETNPLHNAIVSQFPANERAARAAGGVVLAAPLGSCAALHEASATKSAGSRQRDAERRSVGADMDQRLRPFGARAQLR